MTSERILLIEDDQALLDGMHDVLALSGYRVTTATNGLAALDVLGGDESLPDLIVSDIMMPDMDGYQLLETLRANQEWKRIPFIFLTAKTTRPDVRLGKELGADDYLTKPFDVEDLLVAIRSRLQRHIEMDELNRNRLAEMQKNILNALHHEFRTPLQFVIAYSDLIISGDEELDPQELHSYLVEINRGGERLMRLVEDVLLLVEMETEEAAKLYQLRKTDIYNLNDFVTEVIASFETRAEEAGVILHCHAAPDLPPVEGDSSFLSIAMRHLLDNAIKFTKGHGSQVEVNLTSEDGYVAISVADDGVGVSPKEHERLFEMFYQANRDQLEQQGTGVGLAIVKHIADLHGGRVHLESRPGKGTTFTLYLPIAKQTSLA